MKTVYRHVILYLGVKNTAVKSLQLITANFEQKPILGKLLYLFLSGEKQSVIYLFARA